MELHSEKGCSGCKFSTCLNDVTANELPEIVAETAKHCDILRKSTEAGGLLVDAMINSKDGQKDNSASVPLKVVENGCGSPCIDLRQVNSELAVAAKDVDLLAMVKNQRLAEKLVGGNIYDFVCRFEPVEELV